MKNYHAMIATIDKEINALIAKEMHRATSYGQQDLHNLFENRKDILKVISGEYKMHTAETGERHTAAEPTNSAYSV